jgi:alanine racemase
MRYSLDHIASVAGGIIAGKRGIEIGNIIIDSRSFFNTRETLFIALEGPNHDGHRFIEGLYKRGVRGFMVSKDYLIPDDIKDAGFVFVEDTLRSFQKIAAFHRDSFTGKVIGITGSNGKTIVKEWLGQVLGNYATVSRSPKSFNSQVGVPLSVLMMDADQEYHILEAGISRPEEMRFLEEIIKPDIGILTNIGDAHQENFKSLTDKVNEKLLLFKDSKAIVFNGDDELVRNSISSSFHGSGKEFLTWSFSREADLRITDYHVTGAATILKADYRGKQLEVAVPFTDQASIQNIMHIWLTCCYLDIPEDIIMNSLGDLESVAMRLEQKEGIGGCALINDYYNADLHSLSIAIDLLINQLPQKKKSIIISELLQTGLGTEELIDQLNALIHDKDLYRIIGIGELFTGYREKFEFKLQSFADTDSFLDKFDFSSFRDEAILLKGARKYKFERISRRLEKRVHNTYVEVSMGNLLHNLDYFRSRVSRGTRIMAMVKAASYGSGTHEIGKFLAHHRIDYLGVAFADEGVLLRESGIDVPVMVMNPGLNSFDILIENRLEPEIFSIQTLNGFLQAARGAGVRNYPVHIKIDTGMHRLGFQPDEINELLSTINSQSTIKIESVFSHLSSADDPASDNFTIRQADIFSKVCNEIKSSVNYDFLRHLVNTSGIIRFPEYHFEMVRLGIGLYGIDTSWQADLKPVVSLKSVITQVHSLSKNEPVGYGNSGKMSADGRIAVIPAGYADGIDTRLGNGKGRFIVNGSTVPTVGRICMDMCMLDISTVEAAVGDEVIIIGKGAELHDMASELNTIPYEILTRIPQRVKRIFLFE